MTKLVFLDTETTSLRYDRRAWEVGLIYRDDEGRETDQRWFARDEDLDLANADQMSLKIGGFYERHPQHAGSDWSVTPERVMLHDVEELTRGAIIVGAVPNFDTEVLSTRMRAHNMLWNGHYHLVDVETLAAGALRMPPPWNFDKLLAEYGLEYDEADRHTALGDTRMVRDLYDAVLAGQTAHGVVGGAETHLEAGKAPAG